MLLTHRTVLVTILVAAAILRLAGSTWGANHYLHPDERFMTMVTLGVRWPATVASYFDSATSPLNPYNNQFGSYVYGTLPLFLAKLGGVVTGDIVYGDAHLPGRWLSALADTGTVALAYWIARRLFSRTAGLIAAVLLAFAPLHIQSAHYYTTDAMAVFFAVAAFAASLKASGSRRWRWFAIAGMCVGLATASKPNLALTAGFLVLPALEDVRTIGIRAIIPQFDWRRRRWRSGARFPVAVATALAGAMELLTFRVAQPYAFAGPRFWDFRLDTRWTDTLDYWRQVQSGHIDMPPSVQWADRTPLVFILDNLVRWGMGPPLGIAALVALGAIGTRMLLGRRWPSWWMLAIVIWAAFHIVYFGTAFVKTQRYLLPAYPFMIVLAAGWMDGLPERVRSIGWPSPPSPKVLHRVRVGLIGVVIGGTIISGVALTTVYLRPQSRVEASEWIYDQVPAGSTIATEGWDDGLPLSIPGEPTDAYRFVQIQGFDPDTDAKLSRLIGQLQQADYVMLSSDRLLGTIPRMPDRYPMMSAYYAALQSGSLGFERVATFESPPSLFGIDFDDRDVEEALTVYDHPYVTIFYKTDSWSAHDAWYLLDAALGDGGVQRRVIDPPESQMMLPEADRREYAESGTWSTMFDGRGHPIGTTLAWYLVLHVMTLPAIPVVWRLLPSLPDRGYALAKTVGVFGVAWFAWLLASFRLVEFGVTSIMIALALAATIGALAIGRRPQSMVADLRQRWRWLAATETIFLTSFLAMLWLRTQNPDLWNPWRGGEKPMELAIFSAILRSPWFPPYDPWLAGGTLHYYYFGYLPWATLSRITGTVPEVAFNLVLPSLFALLIVNTWSAAAALVVRMRGRSADAGREWTPILLALAAPVAVGVLGNLDLVRRLGQGWWGADPAPATLDRLGSAGQIVWGIRNALIGSGDLPVNAFWDTTRVIPNTINEFPYFSFLFGDLHAHVLAMPVVAAMLAVAVSVATSTADGGREGLLATIGDWRRVVPVAMLTGFLGGVLLASNPWDYPAAIGLAIVAAAIRAVSVTGLAAPWRVARDVAVYGVLVIASGRILFQPFLSHYGSVTPQILPANETTLLDDYLTIHGAMLLVIGGYLAVESWRVLGIARRVNPRGRLVALMLAITLIGSYALAFTSGNTAMFLIASMATVTIAAIGRLRDPAHMMILAMTGLAFALALFAEQYRFWNDSGRMNLVFKLYLHAWQLLAICAAVGAVALTGRIARTAAANTAPDASRPSMASALAGRAWLVALAIVLIGAAGYPVLATSLRLGDRFAPIDPTLDGFAYMDVATVAESPLSGGEAVTIPLGSDRAAVDWLRENIEGSPVILEAQLPAYRWGGRISSQTGLPTVLGWTFHEIQQRTGYTPEIDRRLRDVAHIYNSPQTFDVILPLLDRYHVELIYIGPLERALYDPAGLAKFNHAVENGELAVLYDIDGVTIYAYDPDAPIPVPPRYP